MLVIIISQVANPANIIKEKFLEGEIIKTTPFEIVLIIRVFMKTNLKLLRKQRNITQISLQIQTGIEQALLSKFERGVRTPPTESLIILADFYNVSIDYILCRTDNPKINK